MFCCTDIVGDKPGRLAILRHHRQAGAIRSLTSSAAELASIQEHAAGGVRMHAEHGLEQLRSGRRPSGRRARESRRRRRRTTRRRTAFRPARAGRRRSLDGEKRRRPAPLGGGAPRPSRARARSSARTIQRDVDLARGASPTTRPSRRRSRCRRSAAVPRAGARCRRSPTPCDVRSRISLNSTGISDAVSADVGSSIISTRVSWTSARAISTICCCPSGSVPTRRSRARWLPEPVEHRGRRLRCAARSMRAPPRAALAADEQFSATVRSGKSCSSWWMMPMPSRLASRGEAKCTGVPSSSSSAAGRLLDAGQDLHERGLAGAVLADQRVHAALFEREVDAVERGRARVEPW